MDFLSLLDMAKQNTIQDPKPESSKYYPAKFSPPKKEKKVSANAKKFLEKREAERQKTIAAKKNRNEISDEDDYGYTSQEASQLYKNLMKKYMNEPEEQKLLDERPLKKAQRAQKNHRRNTGAESTSSKINDEKKSHHCRKVTEHGSKRGSNDSFSESRKRRRRRSSNKNPILRCQITDDEDSEYDSEMHDFIIDFDNMDSSFAEEMRQEYVSNRIGLMEHSEDVRMKAEEKKRRKRLRNLSGSY